MRKHDKKATVGVLIGRASSSQKARSVSRFLKSCVFCASSTAAGTTLTCVLSLPEDHKWWVDSIAAQPKATIGLEEAEVFYAERIAAQSPWSSGTMKIGDKPPCGADCAGCPVYKKSCPGCIATHYYTI